MTSIWATRPLLPITNNNKSATFSSCRTLFEPVSCPTFPSVRSQPSATFPHPRSHGPSVPSKYPNKFKCNATKWDHLHVPFLFNRIYHLTLWPSLTNGTQGDGGDGGWFLMAVTWKRKRERKRERDTLLPEMALTQRGGVNSPDVLQWNQSNYSPGSACVISSTDVKIIASAQLKFNATAPMSQPRMQKT